MQRKLSACFWRQKVVDLQQFNFNFEQSTAKQHQGSLANINATKTTSLGQGRFHKGQKWTSRDQLWKKMNRTMFNEEPKMSLRIAATPVQMHHTTMWDFLIGKLKHHPLTLQIHQESNDLDTQNRIWIVNCEIISKWVENEFRIVSRGVFSDGYTFFAFWNCLLPKISGLGFGTFM